MAVRHVAVRIFAALLGVTVGLATAEVGLRVFRPQRTGPLQVQTHPHYFSISVPNLRGRENLPGVFTWSFTHDSAGRRVTGPTEGGSATARVLLLGDSFTYGLGVNDDQTFAYLLRRQLSAPGRHIEVINAGNQGMGTDYALRFFELEGRRLRPDVTVLGFFANDFRDNARKGRSLYRVNGDGTLTAREFRQAAGRLRLMRRSVYRWFASWSHLANLVRVVAIAVRQREIAGSPVDASVGYVTEENAKVTEILLRHLATMVRDARSDFLVFYFPSADETDLYRKTRRVSKGEAIVREALMAVGHEPISLTPALARSPEPLERLYYDEGEGRPSAHWTPAGHAVAAEVIGNVVKARLEQRKTRGRQ